MDRVRKQPFLNSDLILWFTKNEAMLQRNSLLILNVILEFIQFRTHEYVRWREELYNLEGRLGVTRDGERLKQHGFSHVDHDFALLNADLAGVAQKLADTELSASTFLKQAMELQRLIGICEDYEALGQPNRPLVSE